MTPLAVVPHPSRCGFYSPGHHADCCRECVGPVIPRLRYRVRCAVSDMYTSKGLQKDHVLLARTPSRSALTFLAHDAQRNSLEKTYQYNTSVPEVCMSIVCMHAAARCMRKWARARPQPNGKYVSLMRKRDIFTFREVTYTRYASRSPTGVDEGAATAALQCTGVYTGRARTIHMRTHGTGSAHAAIQALSSLSLPLLP